MILAVNFLLASLVALGCTCGRGEPRFGPPSSGKAGTFYHVSLAPDEVPVNSTKTVVITVAGESGYHWNEEYPAVFKIEAPEGLEIAKTEFSARKKEIQVLNETGRIAVPVTPRRAQVFTIRVKGDFSVCNETTCKVMRNETFSVLLKGK